MSFNHKSNVSGVVSPGLTKYATVDDDVAVKRPIQRRNVYKGGDKRHRKTYLGVGSLDRYDQTDGGLIAKSAPGSGRSSPTDFLSLSLATPTAWTPSTMTNPPIEAKVVILGAQGEYC